MAVIAPSLFRGASACAVALISVTLPLSAQTPPSLPGAPPLAPSSEVRGPAGPLPAAGQEKTFSYQRYDSEGAYVVTPTDGSAPFAVPEKFLGMIMRRVPEADQARVLAGYIMTNAGTFETTVQQAFPDAQSATAGAPFAPVALGGDDGSLLNVGPDAVAAAYVRVQIAEADGRREEFSIAKGTATTILQMSQGDAKVLIAGFRANPFHLPETMRAGYRTMDREAWRAEVLKIPELGKFDFIKYTKLHRAMGVAPKGGVAAFPPLPPPPNFALVPGGNVPPPPNLQVMMAQSQTQQQGFSALRTPPPPPSAPGPKQGWPWAFIITAVVMAVGGGGAAYMMAERGK